MLGGSRFTVIYVTILLQIQDISGASVLNEDVTDAPACSDGEFRCMNGLCVAGLSQCNGTAECSDASDETFSLCRNFQCSEDQFRCAYGACVDGGACDGVQDCVDNSDELLTRCLSETARTVCDTSYSRDGPITISCRIATDCANGEWLPDEKKCDGKVDCMDGSDETLSRCGETRCGDKFQCAYGGCTHRDAMCNGVTDCADRSDESVELCKDTDRILRINTRSVDDETTLGPLYTSCILPSFPENGSYVKYDGSPGFPGERLQSALLNYTCNYPYRLVGKQLVYCLNGFWSDSFPTCKLFCQLGKDQSVEYRCLLSQDPTVEGTRECNDEEPPGTKAWPVCRSPNFFYPGTLTQMHCEDGKWDYTPLCEPECGRVTARGTRLIAGGRVADQDELPWHAGIYLKLTRPYEQICGGTIISTKVVLSAAHCFWNVTLQPASHYAVAVGKLNRDWDNLDDDGLQRRDILDIKIPARYRGVQTHFQDDIALLVAKKGIQFSVHVRPVCLDFKPEFDAWQLQPGNKGKVAGWGYTSEKGHPSPILKVTELPYVSIEQCLEETPYGFKSYITSDKICAGYRNGTAVCRGDSGGGLAFPEVVNGITRYYLRGIVSTAPGDGTLCNTMTITSFTHVLHHQRFITGYFETFSLTKFRNFDVRQLNWE